MLAKSQIESMASGNKTVDPGSHPVIRTLYDHMGKYALYLTHLDFRIFTHDLYFRGGNVSEISPQRSSLSLGITGLHRENI